jgi:hypothetical protein
MFYPPYVQGEIVYCKNEKTINHIDKKFSNTQNLCVGKFIGYKSSNYTKLVLNKGYINM